MNIKTQILVGILAVLMLAGIFSLVKKQKIQLKYALLWCALVLVILFLDFVPEVIGWLAQVTGVGVPINILFFLGFCFLLVLAFTQTIIISNLSQKSKRATQELGLLRKRLTDLEREWERAGKEELRSAGDGHES